MALHWLNEFVKVRRLTYTNDDASLATVFTNVSASVQQDDVGIQLSGGGYAARTFTIFTDASRTIIPGDRVVDSDGTEYRVLGAKVVTAAAEDYTQLTCEEGQD